ncbi:hypothetical protein DFS34DRAFT_621925 [Phlyctochytrium arcticum]|nr:hypothetical protein DFS34DRAFT_621925 [Phlyctochytrium arcticum]
MAATTEATPVAKDHKKRKSSDRENAGKSKKEKLSIEKSAPVVKEKTSPPATANEEPAATTENVDAASEETPVVAAPLHNPDRSRTTLFVSTIPYSATSEQLQDFFSEVGPLRSCYVVADKEGATSGQPKNKGFGYVAYALAEDAATAVATLRKAKFLGGRTLRIQFAYKKHVAEQRKAAGLPLESKDATPVREPTAAPTEGAKTRGDPVNKPRFRHGPTKVQITGLKADTTKKHIYKKARKYGAVEDLVFPTSNVGEAVVTYATGRDANHAVKHLEGHIFKGVKIGAKDLSLEQKEAKRARLIIRNLAWQCEALHLKKAFGKFGTIVDCRVPQGENGKAKGFGFVQFESAEDAEKAIEEMNGHEILRRAVAVDWALPKNQYDRAVQQEEAEEESGEDKMEVVKEENATDSEDASGEDEAKVEEEKDGEDADSKQEDADDEDASDSEDDGVDIIFDQDGNAESAEIDRTISLSDEADSDSEDEASTRTRPRKKPSQLSANVAEGCTLFVRNLSFETTQEGLTLAFTAFGPVRYARIVLDQATGRPRGTAFVSFMKAEDASKCLAAYESACKAAALLEANHHKREEKGARQHKKLQPAKSILIAEPSLTAGTNAFVVDGRFLNLSLAVERSEANKLAEDGKIRRRAEDQRNLYLMREGVIYPESEAAKAMSPTELEKRQDSFAQRKRLLAINPNLYISRTRLSIRNLGLKVDDKELKRVALIAIKKFWDEVNSGERDGMEPAVLMEEEKEGKAVPSGKRKVVIKQAKILRNKDRIDAATQIARSKGYGFVEFESHADALACLRWMNNNPRAFGAPPPKPNQPEKPVKPIKKKKGGKTPKVKEPTPAELEAEEARRNKRPIVEFAIENKQVLKRRDDRVKPTPPLKRKLEEADGTPLSAKKKRFLRNCKYASRHKK